MKELDKSYQQLYHFSNNGNRQQPQQITLQTFSNILTPVLPPILIPGVFDAFDENRDGQYSDAFLSSRHSIVLFRMH